jgi:DNA-directed RNA polymerase III subunit RPC3
MVVKLNFEKCNVVLRNQQLTNYAHRYIGDTTSKVFRALLFALENRITRCFDSMGDPDWEDTETADQARTAFPSLNTILRYIPENIDLSNGLPEKGQFSGINGHSSSAPVTISSSDTDTDSDEEITRRPAKKRQKRGADAVFLVEKHLRILEQDPRGFVTQVENNSWTVPFRHLTRSLIQYEIENTIAARYGQLAARIVRILQKNMSNDEKGLALAAVIKPKDVRSLTNTLLASGMIETQEIPRDTNRTTNRLLWLYAYSPEKARKHITIDSYRAMSRYLRRLEIEKTEYSATIDKSERTDVIGHEDQYLNAHDKVVLEKWSKKEEVILGQVSRIDDLVACMRDFAPPGDTGIGHRQLVVEEDQE